MHCLLEVMGRCTLNSRSIVHHSLFLVSLFIAYVETCMCFGDSIKLNIKLIFNTGLNIY